MPSNSRSVVRKTGNGNFGPINQRRETLVMALAGFAEQHGFDAAAGSQRFLDEANAFDADAARFRLQSAAQGQAKFFEPAIVAAGDQAQPWRSRSARSWRL